MAVAHGFSLLEQQGLLVHIFSLLCDFNCISRGGGLHLAPPCPLALLFLTIARSDMDENYGCLVANIFPQKKTQQSFFLNSKAFAVFVAC